MIAKFLDTVPYLKTGRVLDAKYRAPMEARKVDRKGWSTKPVVLRNPRSVPVKRSYTGYVYDFSVPGTERFIANGIVCHNSGSAIITEDNLLGGLLFAGGSGVTIANKISNVVSLLGIRL
jgi:hypothetical protein